MKNTITYIATAALACAIAFCLVYARTDSLLALTCAITFGTTAYHFWMRLLVGLIFDKVMNNRADYTKKWYQCGAREKRLYQLLGVKRWKNKMPTYDPALFDRTKHSWDEIAQAMCQAELVHETIVLLSFVPVLFSIWLGSFWVFLITSLIGAAVDLAFVVMQRYNRPRIIKLIRRTP